MNLRKPATNSTVWERAQMRNVRLGILYGCMSGTLLLASATGSAQTALTQPTTQTQWKIVVNNSFKVPHDTRTFNSYNQPSINMNKLVVFRARSTGGDSGEPAHGVFLRNMAQDGTAVTALFDRTTSVPPPNNIQSPTGSGLMTFTEPPSFPRIDMWSDTVVSRGSHSPVWEYQTGTDPATGEPILTRGGTTGIYTNPFGPLITGIDNFGNDPEFRFFRVPEVFEQDVKFDVFPGAPAVTGKNIIVFKGNYSVPDVNNPGAVLSKTGVYYRLLTQTPIGDTGMEPAGGTEPATLIADSNTLIPGTDVKFGSTAPPSAADMKAVFAGFDNEDAPSYGGIYLAPLNSTTQPPPLTPLVKIGDPVPGQKKGAFFNKLGEGVSFDGRFVAFWGAWGSEVKNLVLQCPNDGNQERVAYCKSLYGDGVTPGTKGNGFQTTVPVHQGIFVYDTVTHSMWAAATSPENFSDFVYWNFSGKVPAPQDVSGEGGGSGGELDGEPARWRSGSFVAVSGLVDGKLSNANVHVAFKARTGEVVNGAYNSPTDGIYLRTGPDGPVRFTTLVATGMDGTLFDPAATYIPVDENKNPIGPAVPLPVTTMGIERDGFRGDMIVINIGMGIEAAGWGGIYMTQIPQ